MPGSAVVGLIPARLDSARLPGKALTQIGNRALIGYVFERARRIPGLTEVVLATTDRTSDEPLVAYAAEHGVAVYRGDVDDVAGRLLRAARRHGAEYFVRLNGDSPFLDPDLIGQGIALARAHRAEFVTNLIGRTFPYGIAVEVVQTEAFGRAYVGMASSAEREHVTPYLYARLEEFTTRTMLSSRPELNRARLVVDNPTDLDLFGRLIAHLGSGALGAGYEQAAATWLALEMCPSVAA